MSPTKASVLFIVIFASAVHLTFHCHSMFPPAPVYSDLETDVSSISLDRKRRIPRRDCVSAQKCRFCRRWSSKVWLGLVCCWLIPFQAPWSQGASALFCGPPGIPAWIWKVYLSYPQQAGDGNANTATSLAKLSDSI